MTSFNFDFIPRSEESFLNFPEPKPAKKYFPKWLKDMPNINFLNGLKTLTATRCIPFTDSFTNGYIQELFCDLKVINLGNFNGIDNIRYEWSGKFKPIEIRSVEDGGFPNLMPNFDGYYNSDAQWVSYWEPKTPKGYSTMYHHPSNRFDLPFHTFTGIIDTDKHYLHGPIPFLIKKGFEGVIPAGTPIYQITFIKRNKWYSNKLEYDEKNILNKYQEIKKGIEEGYKKLRWTKKVYE